MIVDKIKAVLQWEKGMTAVNLLFVLSLLIRSNWIALAACAAWIVYLAHQMKSTSSKAVRVLSGVLIALAGFIIAANLYASIKRAL